MFLSSLVLLFCHVHLTYSVKNSSSISSSVNNFVPTALPVVDPRASCEQRVF